MILCASAVAFMFTWAAEGDPTVKFPDLWFWAIATIALCAVVATIKENSK